MPPPEESQGQRMEPAQTRILVIDDDAGTAQLISDILAGEGYPVETAGTAKEGLERVAAARPQLILLDVMLPDMNGLELLSRLRRSGDRTLVVVMSTLKDQTYRSRATQLGARDFMSKPFTPPGLIETVRKALQPAPPGAS